MLLETKNIKKWKLTSSVDVIYFNTFDCPKQSNRKLCSNFDSIRRVKHTYLIKKQVKHSSMKQSFWFQLISI